MSDPFRAIDGDWFADLEPWDDKGLDIVKSNYDHVWGEMARSACYNFPSSDQFGTATLGRIYVSPFWECFWLQPYIIYPGLKQIKLHTQFRYGMVTGTAAISIAAGMGITSTLETSTIETLSGIPGLDTYRTLTLDCPQVETPTLTFLQMWHQGALHTAPTLYAEGMPSPARVPWMYRISNAPPLDLFRYALVVLAESPAKKSYADNAVLSRHRIVTYERTAFPSSDLTGGASLDIYEALGVYPKIIPGSAEAYAIVPCTHIMPRFVMVEEVRDARFSGTPAFSEIAAGRPTNQSIPRGLKVSDKRSYRAPKVLALGAPYPEMQSVSNRTFPATRLWVRSFYIQKSPAAVGASDDVERSIYIPLTTHYEGRQLDIWGVFKHQGELNDPFSQALRYEIAAEVVTLGASGYAGLSPGVKASTVVEPRNSVAGRESDGYDMVSNPANFFTEGCYQATQIDRLLVEGTLFRVSLKDGNPAPAFFTEPVPPMDVYSGTLQPVPRFLKLTLSALGSVSTTVRGRIEAVAIVSSDPPESIGE
jgi:hypothetical protein